MKAAILEELDKIEVKDVPEPKCGDNEAILKVKACAVCGSDIRIYHYGNDRVKTPAVMGHEISGEVVEVGKNVERVKVEDRVALGADVPCGKCYWCQNGMGTNCNINYAVGYQFAGGFQEYMVLNETILNYGPVTPVPDHVTYEEAALAEPLACAVNGFELGRFSIGKSLAILGLGPIGIMMLELSKVYGASKVFATTGNEGRLELSKPFLPEARFINIKKEDTVETIMRETEQRGIDFVVTSCGSVQAHADAIHIVAHRGVVNLFGGLKNQPKLEIDSNLIHYKECFIMGSHGSLPRHLEIAVNLIANKRVNAQKYISRTFPLAEIKEAIEYSESKQGLKTVVIPGE